MENKSNTKGYDPYQRLFNLMSEHGLTLTEGEMTGIINESCRIRPSDWEQMLADKDAEIAELKMQVAKLNGGGDVTFE